MHPSSVITTVHTGADGIVIGIRDARPESSALLLRLDTAARDELARKAWTLGFSYVALERRLLDVVARMFGGGGLKPEGD